VTHLMSEPPKELVETLRFRNIRPSADECDGTIVYSQNTGGIQIRPNPAGAAILSGCGTPAPTAAPGPPTKRGSGTRPNGHSETDRRHWPIIGRPG